MSEQLDYYSVLQVAPDAEPEVIEAAYRRLARKYHPDVNRDPNTAARMKEINQAYEVLSDAAGRRQYDDRRSSQKGKPLAGEGEPPKGVVRRTGTAADARRPISGAAFALGAGTLLVIAITAALVIVVLGPFSDGSSGGGKVDTPTAATSPTTTLSPDQQLLEQVVLRAEDLPAGLVQIDASTSTNEDIAAGQDDPEQELARLESMGRVLGYEVNFVPGSESPPTRGMLAASSSASLYLTPEGAGESFAADAQEARSADWPAAYPNLTDVEVKEVERPGLADEVVWIRITGLQSGEDNPMFIEDFVVLRRSRLRGFLRAVSLVEASAGRDALLEDVADLAALHTQRIDAALQGS